MVAGRHEYEDMAIRLRCISQDVECAYRMIVQFDVPESTIKALWLKGVSRRLKEWSEEMEEWIGKQKG